MNYAEKVTADQRLRILQALAQDNGYSHNEHVLASLLDNLGHAISGDKLRTELLWLAEQGLLEVGGVSGMMVAILSIRGHDVATGRATAPGVARPRPN